MSTQLILPRQEDWGVELNEETRRIARQQLREDEAAKQQALQQLRDWIRKSQDIQDCRLGKSHKQCHSTQVYNQFKLIKFENPTLF
jgi:hypothetical protein